MSDKLELMADDVGAVAELVHEDAFPHSSQALRRAESALRTLSAVLAKVEGAMEKAVENSRGACMDWDSAGRRAWEGSIYSLRAALAELREVRR